MKTLILSVITLYAIALSATAQNSDTRVFQLSFISPFGTNGLHSHLITNSVSFNLLGGYSYGNTAFEFGGLYNVNIHLTKGIQFAGIANYTGQSHRAVHLAGVINIATKGTVAAQLGGVANITKGASAQIGGVINMADSVKGTQIAGVINTAKQVKGTQIAGVANIASQGSVGTQIGTIFNSAQRIRGTQIGLINNADSCDGVQIGLINIVKYHGKHEFELSFSEALNTAVSFKLGSNKLYTIFSVGINYLNEPVQYAYGVGLGTHQNWGRMWGSQIEIAGYQLSEDGEFQGGLNLLGQLKLTASKQIANHCSLFLGPVLNMTLSDYVHPKTGKIGTSLAPYTVWEQTNGKTNMKAWIGFTAGLRF